MHRVLRGTRSLKGKFHELLRADPSLDPAQRLDAVQWVDDLAVGQLLPMGSAEFGLWFRHKGTHAFEGNADTTLIRQACSASTRCCRRCSANPGETVPHLREQSRSIALHLDCLFEQANELEAGRTAEQALAAVIQEAYVQKAFRPARSTNWSRP